MFESCRAELIEMRALISILLVPYSRKHDEAAIHSKHNRSEAVVSLDFVPAADRMRKPVHLSGVCVDYGARQTAGTASPRSQDVMASEIGLLLRRLVKSCPVHAVFGRDDYGSILSGVPALRGEVLELRNS